MTKDFFSTEKILPKCCLAVIQKYWYKKIPTNYPNSSSTFAFVTTKEEKQAVLDMEAKLDTEDSIITPDLIPTNETVNDYLGTYDVIGDTGVLTLLSPNAIDKDATSAIAFHYNNESATWEKIEDIQIIDGYVYGILNSFSPIAVFTFRKDTFLDDSKTVLPVAVFVCNGIKTKIYTNENGETVTEDAYGKITVLPDGAWVIGGSIDGSDIESTDITVYGVTMAGSIIGGSFLYTSQGNKNYTKNIRINAKDSTISSIVGVGIWNCVDNLNITAENCKCSAVIGAQECYFNKITSNATLEDSTKRLLSNQWIKKSEIHIKDCESYVVYAAGNSGYSYTKDATLYIDGGKYTYVCNGQSNGTVDYCFAEIKNATIDYLNTNNRGHYGSGDTTVKNCIIKEAYIFADPKTPDTQMADISGKISMDIEGSTVINDFCVGAISNIEVATAEVAKKYIKSFKISRDAKITYTRNAESILKDIIILK